MKHGKRALNHPTHVSYLPTAYTDAGAGFGATLRMTPSPGAELPEVTTELWGGEYESECKPMKTVTDDLPLPEAARGDAWQDHNGQHLRLISSTCRGIDSRPDVILYASAVQLADGSIDNGNHIEPPVLYIDVKEERGLTAVQARALGTALVNAAARLDRWQQFTPV